MSENWSENPGTLLRPEKDGPLWDALDQVKAAVALVALVLLTALSVVWIAVLVVVYVASFLELIWWVIRGVLAAF